MIKAVFFDVGGTLIRPQPSVGDVYARVAKAHGIEVSADELNQRFAKAWGVRKAYRLGMNEIWWQSLVDEVFQPYTTPSKTDLFNDIYQTFARPESWMIFPDVKPALSALKDRELKLGVISNWDSRLPQLLSALELTPYFDGLFISYQFQHMKPESEIFWEALNGLGVPPEEALHIGDDPDEDIRGAVAVGLKSYLLDRSNRYTGGNRIASLMDILSVMEKNQT